MAVEPGTRFRAWPELGCQATMASTLPEASTWGVSLVGTLISSTSDSLMPFFSRALSSSRWETKPISTPIFLPFRSATELMPRRAMIMSLPLE